MVYTEGEKTNPTNGTLLADTGGIGYESTHSIEVLVTPAIVSGVVILQRRDYSNSTTVWEAKLKCPVDTSNIFRLSSIFLAGGERLRVIQDGTIVGKVQVCIVT